MVDIKKYNFKVGDEVIKTDGVRGKIIDICTCSECLKRNFCEPIWLIDGEHSYERYITKETAGMGFIGFHKIGDYIFNEFDKGEVLAEMAGYEKELKRLRKQLKVIEEYERYESV